MIGQLEEFAKRVSQELQEPDWDTRRNVVRALVKKVEVDEQEVRIVYRPGRPGWLPTQVSGKEVTSPPPNADDEFGWLVLGVVVW